MSSRLFHIASRTAGVLTLLVAAVALYVYVASERRLTRVYAVASSPSLAAIAGDTVRGRHLAENVLLCSRCHGLSLGGQMRLELPFASLVAPNLTAGRGGIAAGRDVQAFDRAVRHGVRADGRPLLVMPSEGFGALSDADVAALAAYIAVLPPVDNVTPLTRLKPLGRLLLAVGAFDEIAAEKIDHTRRTLVAPPSDSVARGEYLANITGCTYCHSPSLRGRTKRAGPPDAPLPPNITPAALPEWSERDFVTALRTGRTPDGRLLGQYMPWKVFRGMSDQELHDIWSFVRSK